MKAPSSSIVVDTNILVSTVLGRRAVTSVVSVVNVAARRRLILSERGWHEARRVVANHPSKEIAEPALHKLARNITIAEQAYSTTLLLDAAECLRLGPSSGNGSVKDAHVLATAWLFEADIWSHDRDFIGTGWPCWSSGNLKDALARENVVEAGH